MVLHAFASLLIGFTLVEVPARAAVDGERSTNLMTVVQNFRQANQTLLGVEEAADRLEPARQARLRPVLALLEEQLGEAANQLSAADQATSGPRRVKLDQEVYVGINADILSVEADLEHLAGVIGVDDYL